MQSLNNGYFTMYMIPQNIKILSKHYPGWAVLIEKFSEKCLKAGDLQEILGLTYRQLNDWENRGIIEAIMKRPFAKKADGWRRFSIFDLFPLGILVELKKQGIPLSRIKKLISNLIFPETINYDLLPNIVYNVETYFYTNLETFIGYDYLEKNDDKLDLYKFSLKESKMIIVIPLNPLIDKILNKLNVQDIKIRKNEDNVYKFVINGIPLALEPLEKGNE